MQITVNGNAEMVTDGWTLSDLLQRFELTPERVAVELNEQLIRRATFATTPLRTGDRVEIVTLVGGG